MGEVSIYKFNLGNGDIAIPWSTVFWPTTHGGSDTAHPNYSELSKSENIQRRENFGASGQHVLDASDTSDYTSAYINLCLDQLTNARYDARGGTPLGHGPLKVRWGQEFSSSSLAESSIRVSICLSHSGASAHPVGSTGDIFLELWAVQDTGSNFDWHCRYRKVNGAFFNLTSNNINGSADVADDAEHECILTLVPSTVTGAFNGSGGLGSATVASDGSITLTVDGVQMLQGTGLQFVINHLATANPDVYYGKGLYHGNNGSLLGYIWDSELYYETVVDPSGVPIADAKECCGSDASPDTTDPGDGPLPDQTAPLPAFEAECVGDGVVPTGGAGTPGSDVWA